LPPWAGGIPIPPHPPIHPLPPTDPTPPGTIWPPLELDQVWPPLSPPVIGGGPILPELPQLPPPGVGGGPVGPPTKAWALVVIGTNSGQVAYRWAAITLPEPRPSPPERPTPRG
jgi:hypothetical protein